MRQESAKRGGKGGVGQLGFHREPRLSIARDQEVHFALVFVAQVVEVEGSFAGIRPEMNGLEEMAGDKVFEARSGGFDLGPGRGQEPLMA